MHLKHVSLGTSWRSSGSDSTSTAGGMPGFDSWWGAKIPHALHHSQRKKKIYLVNIHCAGKGPKGEAVSLFQLRNDMTLCEDTVDTEVERDSRHVKGKDP